jgi:Mg/Co/Ni transporter MgtE
MNASFIKFLLVTLAFCGVIGALMYRLSGAGSAGGAGTSDEQEVLFLSDVQQADSLHIKFKKTDPAEQASVFSDLKFRQEAAIERMKTGYKADTVFQSLTQTTGRNYGKLLTTVVLQASDRETKATTKEQLVDQIASLKTEVQSLETQLMLKQSSLESMRAIKAAQQ